MFTRDWKSFDDDLYAHACTRAPLLFWKGTIAVKSHLQDKEEQRSGDQCIHTALV